MTGSQSQFHEEIKMTWVTSSVWDPV